MAKYGMEFIEMVERGSKPRQSGLTLVSDQGLGLGNAQGWLEAWGDYIDYCKFYHVTPRLLPETFVRQKTQLYREYNVTPMIGGIYLELAHCQNKVDRAIEWLGEIGFGAAEISDNFVEFTRDEKADLIHRCGRAGLEVIHEYGRKYYEEGEALTVDEVAEVIQWTKDLGVRHTIVEESVIDLWLGKKGEGREADKLLELADRVGREHIVWEPGERAQFAHLIRLFGPEVNLGPNIPPELIMWLEPGRRGFGRAFGYQYMVDEYERYQAKAGTA